MGRLAAEHVNGNCTGIYFPASNSMVPNDAPLPDRLRTFHSVDELYSGEISPVPLMEEDDPRLAAVVAQAKATWPRFTKAFQNRRPDDRFRQSAVQRCRERGMDVDPRHWHFRRPYYLAVGEHSGGGA